MPGQRFPNRGLGAKLREHFEKHPGQTLYLTDLAQHFGVEERAIQHSMYDVGAKPGYTVEIRARAWSFKPEVAVNKAEPTSTAPARRMFEEIGTARDESIIIQDEAGKLYQAREL
jgi:hypothetical protein